LSHPLVIKPELSPEEDSVFLKERWRLILSGIPRSEIKIRDSRLYRYVSFLVTLTSQNFSIVLVLHNLPLYPLTISNQMFRH